MVQTTHRTGITPWLAILVLMIGSWLRWHELGHDSLWGDEIFSADVAAYYPIIPAENAPWFERKHIFTIEVGDTFWTAKATDQTPLLFEFLLKAPLHTIDTPEIAARFISLVAGVFLLLATCFLVWRHATNKNAPTLLFLLILYAFSPILVEFSQEARSYMLGLMIIGLILNQWLLRLNVQNINQILDKPIPWWELILYVLACHTHYNLLIISFIILSIYSIYCIKERKIKLILRLFWIPVLVAPWIYLSLHTIISTGQRGNGWVEWGFTKILFHSSIDFIQMIGIPLIAITALFLIIFWNRNSKLSINKWYFFIFAIGVLAVYFIVYALMTVKTGMYNARHLVFVIPFLYCLIADLVSKAGFSAKAFTALGIITAALGVFNIASYYQEEKLDYRGGYQFAFSKVPSDAPVFQSPSVTHYYVDAITGMGKLHRPVIKLPSTPEGIANMCEKLVASRQSHIALVGYKGLQEMIRDFHAGCSAHYHVLDQTVTGHVHAEVWKLKPSSTP